jgi:hypothetical protein
MKLNFYNFQIISLVVSLELLLNGNLMYCLYGFKGYTQLELGNINLLISVPHDGYIRPGDIKNRTESNIVTDYNTRKFANILKDELSLLFKNKRGIQQAKPFIIYNNLHRTKLDPNRNDVECCNNKQDDAYRAYTDYHSLIQKYFVDDFIFNGQKRYEQGLLIDM